MSTSPKLPGEAVPRLNAVLYQTEQLPPSCLSFLLACLSQGEETVSSERLKVQIFMQSRDSSSLGFMQTPKIASLNTTRIQPWF